MTLNGMTLRWQLDPVLIGGLVTFAVLYALTVGPLRDRLAPPGQPLPWGRAATFFTGLLTFYLAEGSPLHDLGEVYLFSAHMVQHLVVTYVVPPLILAGLPGWLLRPLLTNRWVKPVVRTLTQPLVALFLFSLAISAWHFPAVYEAQLRSNLVHHLQHVLFLSLAFIVWWPVMSPLKELPRLGYGLQTLYFAGMAVGQFLVTAMLAFAQVTFYPTYVAAPRVIPALTPLADQQLGGIIMKITGFVVFGVPLTVAFFRWFQQENAPSAPKERHRMDKRRFRKGAE